MQRGISGKTRRGAPALGRQRKALRVVQLTLLAVAVFMGVLAVKAWDSYRNPPAPQARQIQGARMVGIGEVVFLGGGAFLLAAGSVAMGVRRVRGPEPPQLD